MSGSAMDAAFFEGKNRPSGRSVQDETLSLFDGNAARKVEPASSGIRWPAPSNRSAPSEAAADALTHTAEGISRREQCIILICRAVAGVNAGMTMKEMQHATGLESGTICPRVIEDCVPRGYLRKTEQRRRTAKASAFVYVITDEGKRFVLDTERVTV